MIVETEEVADQLFMDDREEQLVKKAAKMKSNWCTLLALSSAYIIIFPSQPISSLLSFSKGRSDICQVKYTTLFRPNESTPTSAYICVKMAKMRQYRPQFCVISARKSDGEGPSFNMFIFVDCEISPIVQER